MIRIAMADDHPIVRSGLSSLLQGMDDVTVVAEHGSAEALLTWLDDNVCDLVLLDLQFGKGRLTGAEATRRISASGGPAVLILTTYATDADILAALDAGARGYLLKDTPTDELERAVRAAAVGQPALSPAVQQRLLQRVLDPATTLTQRELEVLQRAAGGLSNHQIAAELFVTVATVKTHLAHSYAKLGAPSRTAAIVIARERGLID
ncbi:MAG TPA: response regulator transcription factor [Propionicimonas sp.]|nr:response regulator transcription factor [Propionicimonas sp.]HQA78139.1 response regulator transcription factor [Propionicimonas sp.]